jgi:hypothetical protein
VSPYVSIQPGDRAGATPDKDGEGAAAESTAS